MAVAVAHGDMPVDGVVQQQRREILEPGLVLRQVDVLSVARGLPVLQRGQHCHHAVTHGDVVDVGTVENLGGAVPISGEVGEARQGG